MFNEGAPTQTVGLTGIGAGPADEAGQPLTVTATSSNTALFANPLTNYTAGATTGTLTFTPLAHAFGTATVTVTVNDGRARTTPRPKLHSHRLPGNDPPTLDVLNSVLINEDAATQVIGLPGIGAGPGESQPLTVSATSSNPAIIPNPLVAYTSPGSTAP